MLPYTSLHVLLLDSSSKTQLEKPTALVMTVVW